MRFALAILLLATPAYAETWELKIPERVELTVGASSSLPISIAVDRGRSVSKDGGIVLDLAPEGAVVVKKRRLSRADAVDPDADAPRFAIPLRAEAAGDFALHVRLRFWVCGQKVCRPVDVRRNVTVSVAAADTPN